MQKYACVIKETKAWVKAAVFVNRAVCVSVSIIMCMSKCKYKCKWVVGGGHH